MQYSIDNSSHRAVYYIPWKLVLHLNLSFYSTRLSDLGKVFILYPDKTYLYGLF